VRVQTALGTAASTSRCRAPPSTSPGRCGSRRTGRPPGMKSRSR
jgi:hypothetical protein